MVVTPTKLCSLCPVTLLTCWCQGPTTGHALTADTSTPSTSMVSPMPKPAQTRSEQRGGLFCRPPAIFDATKASRASALSAQRAPASLFALLMLASRCWSQLRGRSAAAAVAAGLWSCRACPNKHEGGTKHISQVADCRYRSAYHQCLCILNGFVAQPRKLSRGWCLPPASVVLLSIVLVWFGLVCSR